MDKDKDNDEIHKIRKKYNHFMIFTGFLWFLILILHTYKVVDKIFFRDSSVIAIMIITALISIAVIQMHIWAKKLTKIGK